jgi:hypothetical protein
MLGIEEVDFAIPEVFQKRSTAIKQVLDNMSIGEREEVYAMVEHYKLVGLPPDIQRQ